MTRHAFVPAEGGPAAGCAHRSAAGYRCGYAEWVGIHEPAYETEPARKSQAELDAMPSVDVSGMDRIYLEQPDRIYLPGDDHPTYLEAEPGDEKPSDPEPDDVPLRRLIREELDAVTRERNMRAYQAELDAIDDWSRRPKRPASPPPDPGSPWRDPLADLQPQRPDPSRVPWWRRFLGLEAAPSEPTAVVVPGGELRADFVLTDDQVRGIQAVFDPDRRVLRVPRCQSALPEWTPGAGAGVQCELEAGHTGKHRSEVGTEWTTAGLEAMKAGAKPACSEKIRHLDAELACDKDAGHPGDHHADTGTGDLTWGRAGWDHRSRPADTDVPDPAEPALHDGPTDHPQEETR